MAQKPFIVKPLDLGTITSGNERANRPAQHLNERFFAGMVWQSNGSASLTASGEFDDTYEVDFCALLGTNATETTTINVTVGGSSTGAQLIRDPEPLPPPSGLYHAHVEFDAPVSGSTWSISIGGHTGDFQASILVLGLKQTPSKYYETQWKVGVRDLASLSFARNGIADLTPGQKLRTLQFKLGWLNEQEMEEVWAPLDEYLGRSEPHFWCFDPEATEWRQRRTFFGWHEESPQIGKLRYDQFERQFDILSLF